MQDVTPTLEGLDTDELDRDPSPIVAIDGAHNVIYVNEAWHAFARDNGARSGADDGVIGSSWDAAIPSALAPAFAALFAQARRDRMAGFDYECSSPTVRRVFHMTVYPRKDDGVLMIHSLRVSEPHPGPAMPALESQYRPAGGAIVMCMHCRRTRRVDDGHWDWVPSWVARMPDGVSHGLCAPCMEHFFPAA